MLHDLGPVNEQMHLLGPIQRGLPLLSAIPKGWPIVTLDIKDCVFFSIPLCPEDRPQFAFTMPALNHMEPDRRFQWKVLPQGMANSPTLCQIFVQQALEGFQNAFPQIMLIHYMDDLLICHKNMDMLKKAYPCLVKRLKSWGLQLATEKVQITDMGQFLGSTIYHEKIIPQKIQIRKDVLLTLNVFQRFLGDISWLRPFLRIPSAELKPLFFHFGRGFSYYLPTTIDR